MDTPIKEPSYLVVAWQTLVAIITTAIGFGVAVWRFFARLAKQDLRLKIVEDKVLDFEIYKDGAESMGQRLTTIISTQAVQDERLCNMKEDVAEIKNILNQYFKWDGQTDRRGRGCAPVD